MRRQRRAAEQAHSLSRVLNEVLQPFLRCRRKAALAADENRRAEPAVLQTERIELGMTAHEYDGDLPMPRPAQDTADSSRAI